MGCDCMCKWNYSNALAKRTEKVMIFFFFGISAEHIVTNDTYYYMCRLFVANILQCTASHHIRFDTLTLFDSSLDFTHQNFVYA